MFYGHIHTKKSSTYCNFDAIKTIRNGFFFFSKKKDNIDVYFIQHNIYYVNLD